MNKTVKKWVAKADGDFKVAGREMRVRKDRNFDAICFHAQQCVEKMMKAVLIHRRVIPPKTHDLLQLDALLKSSFPLWAWPAKDLKFLARAAVAYRYPGDDANRDEAVEAMSITRRIRQDLLALLI